MRTSRQGRERMKQLRVTVSADGATKVAVECGVVGADCQSLTANLERALGVVMEDTPTEAMYATADKDVDA